MLNQINSEMNEQGYMSPHTAYESDSTISDGSSTDADYRRDQDLQHEQNLGLHDMSLDPRLPVSDHDSDGELSTVGFNDYDTDDEEASTRDTATFSRLEQNPQEWCSCSNCSIMESELESYCCTESSLIVETVIGQTGKTCVTYVEMFQKAIEDEEMLKLQANGLVDIKRHEDGTIRQDSLRFTAYSTFLQICNLRFCGKGVRYVLPSCVVRRIRELFPSPDGQYRDFMPGLINSRI